MDETRPTVAPLPDVNREPPFAGFIADVRTQSPLRQAITAACRRPEPECVPALLEAAALPPSDAAAAEALARRLVEALRRENRGNSVEDFIQEYALSSHEGTALMCLAEALLRIPDDATRSALIRDKISAGDWRAHVGHSPSMLVNAATWGLLITGRLTATVDETSLSSALTGLIGRGGEPLIRRAVDLAMRLMGEQFVTGQTIEEALVRSRRMEAKGFRYSYDMLGEAAVTAEDAARYLLDYEAAIHAIGAAANGSGVLEGPGISIKLSALHPRYSRAQSERVMWELWPGLRHLALIARRHDIGLNIDAEEADRLELSLDLLEALCVDPDFAGWNGIGFVVQAYQKRAPSVIGWIIDLARRSGHRLMVRLVKGAYWDSEIKKAQVDGLEGFPVFTRKAHTDVSYLACARRLLDAPDAVFPQFATHNAATLASVYTMAGAEFYSGQYEFQCLHGMGEPLYEEVAGPGKLDRPCRIYAPVGTHGTLLAYLVRRLLENGANSSFVNRIADPDVPVSELVADPVAIVRASHPVGTPHPLIAAPPDLFAPDRRNSTGLDLTSEQTLASLATSFRSSAATVWHAPTGGGETTPRAILNPADHRDQVGLVWDATPAGIEAALTAVASSASSWAATDLRARAACIAMAADALEARMPILLGLLVREAGKTLPNAIGEVREAVDFLRFYGGEAVRALNAGFRPLGPVACISPWNFPLSTFAGQIAAALVAGNPVLAKPAEETPLIAAEAVRLLHEAGVPADVLRLVPGDGAKGAALVADARVQGVVFTGSTSVARLIQRQLADRLTHDGMPIPLIAETGGMNAMIVDSTALAEQVVADVITSAFDSSGQRCSALRILCLQEDIADRTISMLKGAMRQLQIGGPDRLDTDIGPVISAEARTGLLAHVDAMRARGHAVEALELPETTRFGTFVAPALIEVATIADVEREVFGPVLHVLRYSRDSLDGLIDEINATGYGLTFGVHTRIDETVARVVNRINAGNIYVNRNMIGAVVGVQPFGGGGLSGTGPKAGGPLYLRRLLAVPPPTGPVARSADGPAGRDFAAWLDRSGHAAAARRCWAYLDRSRVNSMVEMSGPVGERNEYRLRPRGCLAALARTADGLLNQLAALFATGNTALVERSNPALDVLRGLPSDLADRIVDVDNWLSADDARGALFDGTTEALVRVNRQAAARPGPIAQVQALAAGADEYDLELLLEECSVSTNTAAAGGNASLMAMA
jgi:RHH-type proline utilization regulon transcriptional repressor/proline dehydrogenase/delta 1-pyrroline-5-carboxylate dehydrogenase